MTWAIARIGAATSTMRPAAMLCWAIAMVTLDASHHVIIVSEVLRFLRTDTG